MTFAYTHNPSLWTPITKKDDRRWKPYAAVQNCALCDGWFSRTCRKHHCRSCGEVVCDSCSRHRITIDGKVNTRICRPCYNHRIVSNAGLNFKSEGFFADMNRWITDNIALCAAWRKAGVQRSSTILPFITFFVALPPRHEGSRWTRRILCINGRDRIFLTSPIPEHSSTIWELSRSTRRDNYGKIIQRTIPLTITHLFHISELKRFQEDTHTDNTTKKGMFSGIYLYFSTWNPLKPDARLVDESFFVIPFPSSCYSHEKDSPCEICVGPRSLAMRRASTYWTDNKHNESFLPQKPEIDNVSRQQMGVRELGCDSEIANLSTLVSKTLCDDCVTESKDDAKFEEQGFRRTRRSKSDFGIPTDISPLILRSLLEVSEEDSEDEKSDDSRNFSFHSRKALRFKNLRDEDSCDEAFFDEKEAVTRDMISKSNLIRPVKNTLSTIKAKSKSESKVSEYEHKMAFPESELLKLLASDDEQCDILQQIILKHQQNFLMRLHRFKDQCKEWAGKCAITVTWDNPEHEKMLFEVFKALRPDLEKPKRKDKKLWGKLGFQGKDPVTDFRGMGILGVEFLHYLGRKKVDLANFLFRRKRSEDAYYPLACSCINLLSLCLELLNFKKAYDIEEFHNQQPLFRVFCSADSWADSINNPETNQLFEMVCYLIVKLDTAWVTSDASYMDYPVLLRAMKSRIEKQLEGEIFSTNELFERIQSSMDLKDFKFFGMNAK